MTDDRDSWDEWRARIIGLGSRSAHKTYYAELQRRLADLRRFRVLLDHSGEAVFLARAGSGTITDVNESACKLLECSRDQLMERPLATLVVPPGWGELGTVPDDAPRVRRVSMVRHDGERLPTEVTVHAATFEGERYIVVVARDLRERLLLEASLHQAEKMESVGRLAGGVAHDFNNILTAIQGNVDLALMDLRSAHPVRPLLEEIQKAAESAASLTRQLLAFSRKQLIEPRPINLNELLDAMRSMLRRLIGEDITLNACPQPGIGTVFADPNLIEQAVINLAINARDAMPDGGRLTLETAEVLLDEEHRARHAGVAPGRYVMLAVSDTGSGMTDEVKQHLFEPFFTTKERGRGTGLGLASVYGTVNQSGGSIQVNSELGVGTCIKMYFPVSSAEARPSSTVRKVEVLGGDETILFVEDEALVASIVLKALPRLGYRVVVAQNGEEALALMRGLGRTIDVLVTDVVLPEMNGRLLAETLLSESPGTRVIFTSGYTENVIVHRGVLEPGVNFVSKPYTVRALAMRIRQVLDAR